MIFVLSYIGCTVQGAIKLMISTFISRGCLCISNRKYFQSYKSKYSERSPFQLQVGSRQFGMQLYPNMGLFKVYKIIMSWLQAVLLFLQIRVAFYQNKLVYFSQLHGNQPNYRIHFGGLFLKALVFLNLQTIWFIQIFLCPLQPLLLFMQVSKIFLSLCNFLPNLTDHKSTITCCRFGPTQNRICTTSMDRTTKITDMLTFTEDYNVTLSLT